MKTLCLLITSICLSFCANANEVMTGLETEQNEIDKVYVLQDQIYIDEASIWVHIDDRLIPVKSLHVDHSGLYITHKKYEMSSNWTCANCGSSNSEGRLRCWWCGELKEWGLQLNQ